MPATGRSESQGAEPPRQQRADGRSEPGHSELQPQQQSMVPMVWSAIGRVAGSAWSAIQLANRYVLAPAAMWLLRNLKEYIEEQIAIQRAMARSCPVPKYGEDEVRQATDNLGPTHRALGTPYGMVAYLTRLRGKDVAVRPVHLGKVADVEAFWAEAAAGCALSTGPGATGHPCIVPYLGCCPALVCHVYEQRPYTCSLREALVATNPHAGALGSWEARLALCQQLVAAVAHLARVGVVASDLSAHHILVRLDGLGSTSTSTSSVPGGVTCWLAPGCSFQLYTQPATAPQQPQRRGPPQGQQQQGARTCGPASGRGAHQSSGGSPPEAGRTEVPEAPPQPRMADMARSLGQVLMQVLGGTDSAVPAPSVVLKALSDVAPCRLLSPDVAPPLTNDQAWSLLAAVYPLLVWGDDTAATVTGAAGARPAAAAAGGGGASWPGAGAARGPAAGSGSGFVGEVAAAAALQGHLTGEVMPVLADLLLQVQRQGRTGAPTTGASSAAAGAAGAGAGGEEAVRGQGGLPAGARAGTPGRTGPAARGPEEDAFAGASAPLLPTYPPVPPASPSPVGQPWPPPSPPHPYSSHEGLAAPGSTNRGSPAPGSQSCHAAGSRGGSDPQQPSSAALAAAGSGRAAAAGPPEDLLCPITQELMEDPVVAADGHSYERSAISQWFAGRPGRPTSPLTGAVLPHTGLTPNYALRRIIGDWRERHGS